MRQRNFVLPYTCAWSSSVPGRGSLLNGVRWIARKKAGNSAFLVECVVILLRQMRFRSCHGVKNDYSPSPAPVVPQVVSHGKKLRLVTVIDHE